jgi:hypothetical protein
MQVSSYLGIIRRLLRHQPKAIAHKISEKGWLMSSGSKLSRMDDVRRILGKILKLLIRITLKSLH